MSASNDHDIRNSDNDHDKTNNDNATTKSLARKNSQNAEKSGSNATPRRRTPHGGSGDADVRKNSNRGNSENRLRGSAGQNSVNSLRASSGHNSANLRGSMGHNSLNGSDHNPNDKKSGGPVRKCHSDRDKRLRGSAGHNSSGHNSSGHNSSGHSSANLRGSIGHNSFNSAHSSKSMGHNSSRGKNNNAGNSSGSIGHNSAVSRGNIGHNSAVSRGSIGHNSAVSRGSIGHNSVVSRGSMGHNSASSRGNIGHDISVNIVANTPRTLRRNVGHTTGANLSNSAHQQEEGGSRIQRGSIGHSSHDETGPDLNNSVSTTGGLHLTPQGNQNHSRRQQRHSLPANSAQSRRQRQQQLQQQRHRNHAAAAAGSGLFVGDKANDEENAEEEEIAVRPTLNKSLGGVITTSNSSGWNQSNRSRTAAAPSEKKDLGRSPDTPGEWEQDQDQHDDSYNYEQEEEEEEEASSNHYSSRRPITLSDDPLDDHSEKRESGANANSQQVKGLENLLVQAVIMDESDKKEKKREEKKKKQQVKGAATVGGVVGACLAAPMVGAAAPMVGIAAAGSAALLASQETGKVGDALRASGDLVVTASRHVKDFDKRHLAVIDKTKKGLNAVKDFDKKHLGVNKVVKKVF